MQDSERTIQLSQTEECAPRLIRGKHLSYRLAYARAAETQAADSVGQDYLATYESEGTFVFALCDGVSQSFYGELAAKYLGDALVDWLRKLPDPIRDAEHFRERLHARLSSLTSVGTDEVQQLAVPPDLPSMLREVLEEKRSLGSETMFVCGRIDLPSVSLPQGRVMLAWMGDARLRVWRGADEQQLPGEFRTAQRWSTRRGPIAGKPHVYFAPLSPAGKAITQLMAYSDGLMALDAWDSPPSNADLEDLISQAQASPASDDLSFLALQIAGSQGACSAGTAYPTEATADEQVKAGEDRPGPPTRQQDDRHEIATHQGEWTERAEVTTTPGSLERKKSQRWLTLGAWVALLGLCAIGFRFGLLPGVSLRRAVFGGSTAPPGTPLLIPFSTTPTASVAPPTCTLSPTAIYVATATLTATPTPSPTTTATSAATVTPTLSPTATMTPTATATLVPSPTFSVTPTVTLPDPITMPLTITPTITSTYEIDF